ncbi:hypothetical protein KZZ08_00825 [Roseovarius mucosus]|uniref:hypothetical protein n=1 Tax=Roseovarius mucosus TaxID=215743 RepID=UPI001C5F1E8D|nr:hypothetical protein [Roseovarius mucosus]MBW4972138.1 hypothetical protein [Roseovarius mucosus]
MPTRRLLIIGFSNVATRSGFSDPTIDRLRAETPDVTVLRVGLGAQQPHVIPPYLRLAAAKLGPFSHVLFEVNASAFALHPLTTPARGRELLLDMALVAQDIGADPAFFLHHRRWTSPVHHDFNAQTREFCKEFRIPLLDMAEEWLAEVGADVVAGLLRDDVHTTYEGGEVMADRVTPFLKRCLDQAAWFHAVSLPKPIWRRGLLDTDAILHDHPMERHDCMDLPLHYMRLENTGAVLRFGQEYRAQALVHLFHRAGGHINLRLDPSGHSLQVSTVDPFSYAPRIGTVAFDFYRGLHLREITISPTVEAPEIKLLKGEPERPLRSYIGPLLTLEPATPS